MRNLYMLAMATVIAALPVTADAGGDDAACKQIRATLDEHQFTQGCTSPRGVCIAGTIDGNRGLRGTTLFVLDSSAGGPTTALTPTVSYSGVFEITTGEGLLTLRETGVNGPKTGGGRTLASVASVLSGTGRYAGATGTLYFTGTNVVPGQFTTRMSGDLCLVEREDE